MKRETVIIAALGILTLAGCNNNHRSQVRKFKQTAEKTNHLLPHTHERNDYTGQHLL